MTTLRESVGRTCRSAAPQPSRPTGVTAACAASAMPVAARRAHAYLLKGCEETHIEAEVSSSR